MAARVELRTSSPLSMSVLKMKLTPSGGQTREDHLQKNFSCRPRSWLIYITCLPPAGKWVCEPVGHIIGSGPDMNEWMNEFIPFPQFSTQCLVYGVKYFYFSSRETRIELDCFFILCGSQFKQILTHNIYFWCVVYFSTLGRQVDFTVLKFRVVFKTNPLHFQSSRGRQ